MDEIDGEGVMLLKWCHYSNQGCFSLKIISTTNYMERLRDYSISVLQHTSFSVKEVARESNKT